MKEETEMMNDMNQRELSLDEMNEVSGGTTRVIQTGIIGQNAAIRQGPSKGTKQIASLENGTQVETLTDILEWDDEAGRFFVEIAFTDKYGKQRTGWVASSIVGMRRK